MRGLRNWAIALTPVLSLGLVTLSGCSKTDTPPAPKGGGAGPATKVSGSGSTLQASAFTGTIKGRVTFNGGDAPAHAKKPDKDQDKCPTEVPVAGWFVEKSADKKGVQFAVVFIKGAGGAKLPAVPADQMKAPAGKEVLEMDQPRCQFEPRVVVLHPGQNLKVKNTSNPPISHDANISNTKNDKKQTLPPGQEQVYSLIPYNLEPNKVSCNQHTSFMSGWIWKMEHPWCAVTDAEGNFEIKNVPCPTNGKLNVVVWHEMLDTPRNMKDIKDVELKAGATETVDIAIPK